MMSILAKYWRPLAIIMIVAVVALWIRGEVIEYGDQRYAEGKAQAIADQKAADKKEEQRRNAELQKIQVDAQQRIDAARNDAVNAAAKSGSCSNNSQTSASSSSDIPPLSPLATQPQKPEFCSQTCSQSLSKEIDNWQITLTGQEKQD